MKTLYILLLFVLSLLAEEKKLTFYDFNATNIDGKEISMSVYKEKVLLIVNVASDCKFTPQYEGLQLLFEKYEDKGFMVLGFPCNQFREQESGSNKEIKFFCTSTYKVSFDMFEKIDVNGKNTLPLYKYLKEQAPGFLWTESIKWNFTKFLVNKKGKVLKRYSSMTTPKEIEKDLLLLLK